MKIYKLILGVVLGATMLTSCNDMLDVETDGHLDMSKIFIDRNRTLAYLNRCYSYTVNPNLANSRFTDEGYDSEVLTPGSTEEKWYNDGVTTDTYGLKTYWTDMFSGIRYASKFIDAAPSFTGYAATNDLESWVAQCHVLRAMYYLQLTRDYGQVPVFTHDISTENYWNYGKQPVSAVVKQIIADCDEALASPLDSVHAFRWTLASTDDEGSMKVMTRGVAEALKSVAILWAVSPLNNDGTYTWNDAVRITGEALSSCLANGYELYKYSSNQTFSPYDAYTFQAPDFWTRDKETIWGGLTRQIMWQTYGYPSRRGTTTCRTCPTQELVDMYDMADGTEPILGYMDADHLQPIYNSNSSYDRSNPYANRDPRFYATVYYNGALDQLQATKSGVDENGQDKYTITSKDSIFIYDGSRNGIDTANHRTTQTGYYLRKFISYTSGATGNNDGYIRRFRLAELYYNFAEAAYNASNPDQVYDLGNGISMSARQAVNTVRARAYMPGLPEGLSNSDFERRYRKDRTVEFAFEDVHYYDIRRWMTLPSVVGVVTGVQTEKNSDGSYTYTRFKLPTRAFTDEKYYFMPIGQTEVQKIERATGVNWQNPGWD